MPISKDLRNTAANSTSWTVTKPRLSSSCRSKRPKQELSTKAGSGTSILPETAYRAPDKGPKTILLLHGRFVLTYLIVHGEQPEQISAPTSATSDAPFVPEQGAETVTATKHRGSNHLLCRSWSLVAAQDQPPRCIDTSLRADAAAV